MERTAIMEKGGMPFFNKEVRELLAFSSPPKRNPELNVEE
jgi:hypothetical protein